MHLSEDYGRLLEAKCGLTVSASPPLIDTSRNSEIVKASQRRARETTDILVMQLGSLDILVTDKHREYRFHPTIGWKFDIAWPHWMVAVEIQGTGNHRTMKGFRRDCEKFSNAFALGWTVVPVTHSMVRSGVAVSLVAQGLVARGVRR